MKRTNLGLVLLAVFFVSCGSAETTKENNTTENSNETIEESSEIIEEDNNSENKLTEIPNIDMELMSEDYEVSELMSEIQSPTDDSQTLRVVMTENGILVLELAYNKGTAEESFELNVGDLGVFGTMVSLEFADINGDEIIDELVIWWSTTDAMNGIDNGYEMDKEGIIIFDVMNRLCMANFCYYELNSNYTAGENADTNSDDYHAKSDDSSIWEICTSSHDLKLKEGKIYISKAELTTENRDDCKPQLYQEGSYEYNLSSGSFELAQ